MRSEDGAAARSRRRAAIATGVCASVAVAAFWAAGVGDDAVVDGVAPVAPVTPTIVTPPLQGTTDPIDTSAWAPYHSDLYDVRMGYPGDWTVDPGIRPWRSDADSADPLSPAHDAFEAANGTVRVSMWFVPLGRTERVAAPEDLVAWVEDYCEATGNAPCSGIEDRGVELCLERRDCHPGLLVPFESDVQAFVSGGIYDADAMTVVAVWSPEQHRTVRTYGGASRLLEGFLSTMEVWPASSSLSARVRYGGRP